LKPSALALIKPVSPDLEKQGFLAVVFVYREYRRKQEKAPCNYCKKMPLNFNITANFGLSCFKQNYHFF
jgi:hypothetical protein